MKKEYSLSGKIGKKALSANITLSPFTEKAKEFSVPKKSVEKKEKGLKLTETVVNINQKVPFSMEDYVNNPEYVTLLMAIDSWQDYLKSDYAKKREGKQKIDKKLQENKKLFGYLERGKKAKEVDMKSLFKEAEKMGFKRSAHPVTYSFRDAEITNAPLYYRKYRSTAIRDIIEDVAAIELVQEKKSKKKPKKKPKKNPPTNFVATGFIGLSSAGITGYAKHALEKRYSRFVSYPALIASLAASGYFMPKNRQAIIVGGLFGILAQEFLAWRMRSLKLSVDIGTSEKISSSPGLVQDAKEAVEIPVAEIFMAMNSDFGNPVNNFVDLSIASRQLPNKKYRAKDRDSLEQIIQEMNRLLANSKKRIVTYHRKRNDSARISSDAINALRKNGYIVNVEDTGF